MILQIIFSVVNFLLIAFLLYKFGGPKVSELLRAKHEENRRALEAAETAQAEASKELASYRERLANVDAELAEIVSKAKQVATQAANDIHQGTEADAARLKQHSEAEIAREKANAQLAIRQEIMRQAVAAAEAEMRRTMSPEAQRKLVATFIEKVGDGSCAIKL